MSSCNFDVDVGGPEREPNENADKQTNVSNVASSSAAFISTARRPRTVADQVELLQGAPVFGALSAEALQVIVNCSNFVEMTEGQHFFEEGARGEAMYVLIYGSASVYRSSPNDDKLVRLLGEGDCFGEMALADLGPRSASVMALEDSQALEIPAWAVYELYECNVGQFALLQMNIAREISRRLRQSDDALFRCMSGHSVPGGALLLTSA